jgi:hypothetical protein
MPRIHPQRSNHYFHDKSIGLRIAPDERPPCRRADTRLAFAQPLTNRQNPLLSTQNHPAYEKSGLDATPDHFRIGPTPRPP